MIRTAHSRYLCASLVAVLSSFGATTGLAQVAPFFDMDSYTFSEPVSIKTAVDGLRGGELSSGDFVFTHNRMEIGVAGERWAGGVMGRYDWHFDIDDDTFEIYYNAENDLDIAPGDYAIDMEVSNITAVGIWGAWHGTVGWERLGLDRWFNPANGAGDGITVTIKASGFQARRLIDGRARGQLTINPDDSFDGSVQLSQHYHYDHLLGRTVSRPSGYGASLDVFVSMSWREWQLDASVVDALTRIWWEDAPFTKARIGSRVNEFDADGRLQISPVLSGIESSEDHQQRLPVRTRVALQRRVAERFSVMAEVGTVGDHVRPQFSAGMSFRGCSELRAGIDVVGKGVELGGRFRRFHAAITLDKLDERGANLLAFRVGYGPSR